MKASSTPDLAPDKIIFRGDGIPHDNIARLPDPPPWRKFDPNCRADRGAEHHVRDEERVAVNAAIYLRRPLLITGKPGTGKSSLAHVVAHELKLGDVLVWPITSRSTLAQGLYRYDAIDRLQQTQHGSTAPAPTAQDIGRFIQLGPLGTAFRCSEPKRPRVLLIDELDKSDIDLPNDLLHLFEEGEFDLPELKRETDRTSKVSVGIHRSNDRVEIANGHVRCAAFPIVIITSNDEREFPPAFLRRCLRLDVREPQLEDLVKIVRHRLKLEPGQDPAVDKLLVHFISQRDDEHRALATDQALNAAYLVADKLMKPDAAALRDVILRTLSNSGQ